MRLIQKIGEWLDLRLQLGASIRETAKHPVPRETASWFYVFGSAALACFMLQIVTGILLALIYVPSGGEAWNSLQTLNHGISLGWFIRALHGWGSNFMVAIVLIHMSAGLLFWRPIIRTRAREANGHQWSMFMPLYLFLGTLPCDILSAFLTFCGRVVYPSYLSAARIVNLSPLQDQECAGALMWVCVTFAYLIPAVVITMQILSPSRAQSAAQVALYEVPAPKVRGSEAEVV